MAVSDTARIWVALTSTIAAVCSGWAAWTVLQRSPSPPPASAVVPPDPTPAPSTPPSPAAAKEPPRLVDSDAFPPHPQIGQSEGLPSDGHLHRPTRLPSGPDRIVRNPNAAFATADTVRHLDAALAELRRQHPTVHRVLVGDLSSEVGGRITGHVSHQSGRDVDVGFIYKERVGPGLRVFEDATRENLNLRATFSLLRELSSSHGKPGGMQWALLDYEVQRIMVQWARRYEAASPEELNRLFQYPKGAYAPAGLFRHYANHRDHVHVRYACPQQDGYCASPPGPPVRLGRRGEPKDAPDAKRRTKASPQGAN